MDTSHPEAALVLRSSRRTRDRMMRLLCTVGAGIGLALLTLMVATLLAIGGKQLGLGFLSRPPSRLPAMSGVGPALAGTAVVALLTAAIAIPIGIGAAIFLEEYSPRRDRLRVFHGLLRRNVEHLVAVPPVIFGLVALVVFCEGLRHASVGAGHDLAIGTPADWYHFRFPMGRTVLAGGLTMILMALPRITFAVQLALRDTPDAFRDTAIALGASRWQTFRRGVLPLAGRPMLAAAIRALAHALGEAAAMLIIVGVVFINFAPSNLMDQFTVLPVQTFHWGRRSDAGHHALAAAALLILTLLVWAMHALAWWVGRSGRRPAVDQPPPPEPGRATERDRGIAPPTP